MKQGALIFDERSDRYDIRFDLADYTPFLRGKYDVPEPLI